MLIEEAAFAQRLQIAQLLVEEALITGWRFRTSISTHTIVSVALHVEAH